VRVLICASGTVGDVHPLVGVAHAMRERGHEVILLANEAYAPLAEEAGVQFEPVGKPEELQTIKNNPKAWTYKHGWKLWVQGAGVAPMPDLYRAIEKLHRPGETILAGAYLCFGARVAAEKLDIPYATIHLNVHTIRTVYNIFAFPPPAWLPDCLPRSYLMSQWEPIWSRRLWLWLAEKFFIDPVMRKPIVRFRKTLGLPPLRTSIREWWNSPQRIIGLFPDWWAGEHPDWPKSVITTSFPFWAAGQKVELGSELRQFLDEAERDTVSGWRKVIVFTPGASATHTATHFMAFERACASLGYCGLVITSEPPPAETSSHVRYERYVPFQQLLSHVAAVVHHAGIGTSAYCLAAGIPQVVIPTLYNQPDSAVRLKRLGVAAEIRAERFNERRLTHALESVLRSPAVRARCEDYACRLRDVDPYPQACDELEALA